MKIVVAACLAVFILNVFAIKQEQAFDLKASMARGKNLYTTYCITCHFEQGEGLEGVYPPLAKSDYMMNDKKRSIQQILNGATGPMKVNGKDYDGVMSGYDLSDQEVSDLLNYVRNSFGNKGGVILPTEVKAVRQ